LPKFWYNINADRRVPPGRFSIPVPWSPSHRIFCPCFFRALVVGAPTGEGNFDMGSYEAYLTGKLEDYDYPAEAVQ
jgi:hypothetical protein